MDAGTSDDQRIQSKPRGRYSQYCYILPKLTGSVAEQERRVKAGKKVAWLK